MSRSGGADSNKVRLEINRHHPNDSGVVCFVFGSQNMPNKTPFAMYGFLVWIPRGMNMRQFCDTCNIQHCGKQGIRAREIEN